MSTWTFLKRDGRTGCWQICSSNLKGDGEVGEAERSIGWLDCVDGGDDWIEVFD